MASDVRLLGCGGCGGVWLDNEGTSRVMAALNREVIGAAQSASARSAQIDCAQPVNCPHCSKGLERVPATRAWVIALPMKIAGGSGGPLRIVAVVRR